MSDLLKGCFCHPCFVQLMNHRGQEDFTKFGARFHYLASHKQIILQNLSIKQIKVYAIVCQANQLQQLHFSLANQLLLNRKWLIKNLYNILFLSTTLLVIGHKKSLSIKNIRKYFCYHIMSFAVTVSFYHLNATGCSINL